MYLHRLLPGDSVEILSRLLLLCLMGGWSHVHVTVRIIGRSNLWDDVEQEDRGIPLPSKLGCQWDCRLGQGGTVQRDQDPPLGQRDANIGGRVVLEVTEHHRY